MLLLLLLLPRSLLGAAALVLGGCWGASSHALHYFYTVFSDPLQELPWFVQVGYMDDQPITRYDSRTRVKVPLVPWMKKVEDYETTYWERSTQILRNAELVFRESLANVRKRYNQSRGFHTWQEVYGCELSLDGRKGGYFQYGYDGKDFVSFDKETLTWTAADAVAQVSKRKWDAELAHNHYRKNYLEGRCIEWLQRYLDYGKEVLLRTERPVGKVTRQPRLDGQETLICQAYGFYPRLIYTTWRRDGEVMEHATFRRDVAPNSDGTYHAWLSIDIDPQDKNHYSCHIEHDSLPEPLVLAWEEPANVGLIVGAIVGSVAAILLASGILFILKNWRERAAYEAASTDTPAQRAAEAEELP